ncbi:NADPH-dependent F420 reductase [Haliangium sp.]|uniref:NADPH-dependent F420 reductase n=1 Tax=Haliangium sp. TaxID=2663208 RepID=UPI003D124DC3
MRIGIIGGTGSEGRGLGLRWARAGHAVRLGSRDPDRARARAEELAEQVQGPAPGATSGPAPGSIDGGGNPWAIQDAEVVVLTVPYGAHGDTLRELRAELSGKLLVDITVPLAPPRVREVHLPAGHAAALEAQAALGDKVRVAATLHHISAAHLADVAHVIDSDVLVCADAADDRDTVIGLIEQLGARALDAGPLRNAIALEAFTPVLLHLNRRYRGKGCGLRITGLPESGA